MKRSRILSVLFFLISVFMFTGTAYASSLVPVESDYVTNPLYEMYSMEEIQAPILFSDESDQPAYENYPTERDSVVTGLRQGMVNRKNVIILYYASDKALYESDLNGFFDDALLETDHPNEGDYLMWSWHGQRGHLGGVKFGGVYYYTITYTISYYTTAAQEAVVAEKIDELIASFAFEETDTDYRKIKTVYDYICDHVTYDHEGFSTLTDSDPDNNDYSPVTAYKALTEGKAVCQGYATLFYRVIETLGIDARLIPGVSRNQGHAWNIVKIGDYYYNLDSTWDAGKTEYQYFLRSQAVFNTGHTRYNEYATVSFYNQYSMGEDYTPTECDISGHDLAATVIPPTCVDAGYTVYTCSVCADNIISDHVPIAAHSFRDYSSDNNASCYEDGTKTAKCIRCDVTNTVQDPGSALGHEFLAYVSNGDSDCTSDGTKTAKCVRCEVTDTTRDIGSALGHDWESEYTVDLEATCNREGKKSLHCTRCAETTDVTAIPVTGVHTVVIDQGSNATCTAPGLTEGSHCSHCGKTLVKQEVIPAFGHTEKKVSGKEANCTQSGLTEGVICSSCNVELKSQEVIQADGHSWDHGSVTKSVSATVAGEYTYTCKVCSEIHTEDIPATGPCDKGETCVSRSFADALGHWGHDAIDYVVENGLMNGTGTGFEPETTMSRAMLVTVLYRYAGEPEPGENTFTDVPDNTWYSDAVSWAANNGVVTGTGDGTTFSPNMPVSREQLATILYRYASAIGVDMIPGADLTTYPDGEMVASWSSDALKWAVAGGLISGSLRDGETYLDPGVGANRAMVATIMMRFIQNVIE